MKLTELKAQLCRKPDAHIQFRLPTGDFVPIHAHVTEVARIDKRFVDCGGTLRTESLCQLQTWFSDDADHRLTAGKLLKILEKAKPFLASEDLEVQIEHEAGLISQFPLDAVVLSENEMVLRLAERHTACLAPDKCLPAAATQPTDFNPLTVNFRAEHSNSDGSGGKNKRG